MNKREDLLKIKEEVLSLTDSPLYEYRIENKSYPVIGEGNHDAQIMFIGEAPGANEAKTGRPFCGQAGEILDELLFSININRKDVYITNIVKDRPPKNRDPESEEILIYAPFLDRQINIIKPKVIATLGRFSTEYILRKFKQEDYLRPISILNGHSIDAETDYGIIKILPLLHPAAVIYNRSKRDDLREAFLSLKKIVIVEEK
jgi:uracil-DNA glycosylase